MTMFDMVFVLMVLGLIFGAAIVITGIYNYIKNCIARYHEVKGE